MSAYIDKLSETNDSLKNKKSKVLDYFDDALDLDISKSDEQDNLFVEKQVLSFIREKALYYAIMDNIDRIESKKDPTKCIEAFEKALGLTLYKDLGADYFEDIGGHFDDLCSPESKIPLGITCLDRTTNGGISSDGDCLLVFMAQPCLGKSLMLSNIAKKVLDQNGFALVITLELSEKMYQRRFSAHISGNNIDNLRDTRKDSQSKIEKYFSQHPGSKLVVKRFPENSITTMNLDNYIDKLIKTIGRTPDIIFVDYLNLMLPKNKTYNSTMYERVGDVARDLRALSAKFKRPVVTATQVNTEGYNTSNIGLENTSESKGIAHTADVVIALSQEEDDIEAGCINAKFLKNRYGKNHIRNRLSIDYETLVIDDFDKLVQSGDDTGSVVDSVKEDENFEGLF
jgi:replicative DNA helicase